MNGIGGGTTGNDFLAVIGNVLQDFFLIFTGRESHAALGDLQFPHEFLGDLHFNVHQCIPDTYQIIVHIIFTI